ncbi:MAG: hypothetical protein ABI859_13725 [Pseudomonadota bacterium]
MTPRSQGASAIVAHAGAALGRFDLAPHSRRLATYLGRQHGFDCGVHPAAFLVRDLSISEDTLNNFPQVTGGWKFCGGRLIEPCT